jgi:hypothetical protein
MVFRVACAADTMPRQVEVPVAEPELVRLQGALLRLLQPDEALRVKRATAEGPCFHTLSCERADELDAAARVQCVALSGGDEVASAPVEWSASDVLLTLYDTADADADDDMARIATIEVLSDGRTVQLDRDGHVEELEPPEVVVSTLQAVARSSTPSPTYALSRVPDADDEARAFGDEDRPRGFQLPAWVGEAAARYVSVVGRAHVLTKAALSTAAARPLCFDSGGVLTRGRRGDQIVNRVTFTLHKSASTCLCGVHGDGAPGLPHRGVKVLFEFCGDRAQPGCAGCSAHAGKAPAPTNRLNSGVCGAAMRMALVCRHGEAGAAPRDTRVALLPAQDAPFLHTLAAACVDLVDANSKNAANTLRIATFADYRTNVAEAVADAADDMLARDGAALALILERQHYFGLTPRGKGAPALRSLDGSVVAQRDLQTLVATHAHLFASAPPAVRR